MRDCAAMKFKYNRETKRIEAYGPDEDEVPQALLTHADAVTLSLNLHEAIADLADHLAGRGPFDRSKR